MASGKEDPQRTCEQHFFTFLIHLIYPVACKTQPLCVQVRTERGMYHFRSARAAASSDAMSTVIDGADQAQYGLPYFAQDDKSTTNGLKYKVWTMNCSAPGVSM